MEKYKYIGIGGRVYVGVDHIKEKIVHKYCIVKTECRPKISQAHSSQLVVLCVFFHPISTRRNYMVDYAQYNNNWLKGCVQKTVWN
jgi:hypothetical protein